MSKLCADCNNKDALISQLVEALVCLVKETTVKLHDGDAKVWRKTRDALAAVRAAQDK